MRGTFALASLTLLLAACAGTPPQPPAPPPVPEAWPQADEGAKPAWAGLLDAPLSTLLQQAARANTDIARAALAWQQSELQARMQGLRLTPSLGASYGLNRPFESQGGSASIDGVRVPVGSAAQWSRSYSASAGVGFEADLWGRLAHVDAQMLASSEAARSDIAAARILIANQVAQAYWTLVASERFEQLAKTKLAAAEAALPLVTLRVREGKLVPLEIDKAAGAVKDARQALAQIEASAAQQRLVLAQLLDQPPPGPSINPASLPQSLPAWAPESPAQVLERRPDVQRARLGVDAALAEARAAQAARYPRLSFSAGLGTGGAQLSNWLSQPLLSLAANLSVPLIDWRRVELIEAQARNGLENAALNLRGKVYAALAEVQTQAVEARRIAIVREATAARLAQAQEAERLAELRLEVGAIARADALQARIARLDAEQGLAQVQLDTVLNRLALLRTLAVPVE